MLAFLKDFWIFLRTRKKRWLLPILLLMLAMGMLLLLGEGSAVAPFIYTLY
jgi:hypothetical protein